MRRLLLVMGTLLTSTIAWGAPCEQSRIPHELEIPEMAMPQEPPMAIELAEVTVRRGRSADSEEASSGGCAAEAVQEVGSSIASTCPAAQNQSGWVELRFKPPVDDRTPPHKMGYRVVLIEGTLPEGLYLPVNPVRSFKRSASSYAIHLVWNDGETDEQEPIDFVVDLIPVDLAGLEGPAYRLDVYDNGSGNAGCTTGRSPRAASPVWLGILFLMLLRILFVGRPTTPR